MKETKELKTQKLEKESTLFLPCEERSFRLGVAAGMEKLKWRALIYYKITLDGWNEETRDIGGDFVWPAFLYISGFQ